MMFAGCMESEHVFVMTSEMVLVVMRRHDVASSVVGCVLLVQVQQKGVREGIEVAQRIDLIA